ncbi:copper resistance CopC/CopD family protein [Natrialbaceae archaeon A-gly3]
MTGTDHGRDGIEFRRLFAVLALAGMLVVAGFATPGAAHAYLSESDPENGEQLEIAPDELTLYFSGDGVVNAEIVVEGPDGDDVAGDPEIDPDDTQIVRVPIDDAGEGMYTVSWEVLADDGHTTTGSFFFSVGDEPLDRDAVLEAYEDDEDEDDGISSVETGSKAALLVGLVGLVGIPVTAWVVVYPLTGRDDAKTVVDRRLTRLLGGATAVTLVGTLTLGLTRMLSMGPPTGDTLTEFLGTPLGQAWLVQLVAIAVLLALLVGATSGVVPRRGLLAGTVTCGVVLSGAVGWTSHSATAIDRLQGFAVDFAHIVGAGLWVGGLAVLAIIVPPLLRDADLTARPALAAGAIRRYSLLALSGVTLAGATGFVLASWHVPTAADLTRTVYGLTLSTKTLLVLIALGLGGFTRFVLLRQLEPDAHSSSVTARLFGNDDGGHLREDGGTDRTVTTFTRAVRLEVAVLVVVLVLSGLLTSAPTAAVAGDDELVVTAIEREYDEGVLELTVLPIAAGEGETDQFVLTEDEPIVFDAAFEQDGKRVDSEGTVRLLADHDGSDTTIEFDLEETEDGTYATVQALPSSGDWELRLTGEPGGSYTSEWFESYVLPADEHDHDHSEHDHDVDDQSETSPFIATLQFSAVAIAIVGSVAVAVESTARNRE